MGVSAFQYLGNKRTWLFIIFYREVLTCKISISHSVNWIGVFSVSVPKTLKDSFCSVYLLDVKSWWGKFQYGIVRKVLMLQSLEFGILEFRLPEDLGTRPPICARRESPIWNFGRRYDEWVYQLFGTREIKEGDSSSSYIMKSQFAKSRYGIVWIESAFSAFQYPRPQRTVFVPCTYEMWSPERRNAEMA